MNQSFDALSSNQPDNGLFHAFSKNPQALFKYIVLLTLGLSSCLSGCSFQQYQPKPIDQIAINARLQAKDPSSPQFRQYLLDNGYPDENLPIQRWGLEELVYAALFFNPDLDVARAQWRAAESAKSTAAIRNVPTVNGNIAHSNQANGDIRPYALGLSIDIPIETANKRDIRIDSAAHLSEIAKFEIGQVAWKLRNQITEAFYAYQVNQRLVVLLENELTSRQEIVAIYQKRFNLGAASNSDLGTAKLQLLNTQSELSAKQQEKLTLLAKLASHLGLPLAKVQAMSLVDATFISPDLPATDTQTSALLNRLDVRIALERYALAEAKLRLEIARQYPDISLSPGYAYEFGDKIWSLGISGLLSLLDKNKAAINEATQLREVEAAQFEALQTKVISEASIANSQLSQAQQTLLNQQQLLDQQLLSAQRTQRRFAAGDADRLELAFSRLETNAAEKNVLQAQGQQLMALAQLENALQQPLLQAKKSTSAIEPVIKN